MEAGRRATEFRACGARRAGRSVRGKLLGVREGNARVGSSGVMNYLDGVLQEDVVLGGPSRRGRDGPHGGPRPPPAFRTPGMRPQPQPRGVVVVGLGSSGREQGGKGERDGNGGAEGKRVLLCWQLACCLWRIGRGGGDSSSALPTRTARHWGPQLLTAPHPQQRAASFPRKKPGALLCSKRRSPPKS